VEEQFSVEVLIVEKLLHLDNLFPRSKLDAAILGTSGLCRARQDLIELGHQHFHQ
jgi:hypothetical protein